MRRGGTDREAARARAGPDRPRDDRAWRAEERHGEDAGERGAARDEELERPRPAGRTRRAAPEDRRRAHGPMRAAEAARTAAQYIRDMTGKEPDEVIALERTGDGGWRIDVQAVETRRIPDSTDILAVYTTELDAGGDLVSYRRTRRFSRCQVQGGTT